MNKFCPKCGEIETKDNVLLNEVCQKCFSKTTPLLKKFKQPKIIICPRCNSFLHKNKWHKQLSKDPLKSIKIIIEKILKEGLQFNPEIKSLKIQINPELPKVVSTNSTINTVLNIKGKINNQVKTENYDIPIQIQSSTCNLCRKQSSQYYESILQLRPKSKELLNLAKELLKNQKNTTITKEDTSKHGFDLYITSTQATIQTASKLKKKLEGEVKITKTLFGEKQGKRVYRTTVLFRLSKPL